MVKCVNDRKGFNSPIPQILWVKINLIRYLKFILAIPTKGNCRSCNLEHTESLRHTADKKVVRWQTGASYSDSIMSKGQELKIIDLENIFISATLIEKKGWIPHAFITIENKKSERILVDPTNWTLNVLTPKERILASKEPEKLAQSLESRGKWAAALSNVGAAMATKQSTATVRNSDGTSSTVTVTEPDKDAQQRAAKNGKENQTFLGSVADYVRESSIQANTVFPNKSISGIVWFEDKKYKEVVLTITIDGVIYEFPFEKKK